MGPQPGVEPRRATGEGPCGDQQEGRCRQHRQGDAGQGDADGGDPKQPECPSGVPARFERRAMALAEHAQVRWANGPDAGVRETGHGLTMGRRYQVDIALAQSPGPSQQHGSADDGDAREDGTTGSPTRLEQPASAIPDVRKICAPASHPASGFLRQAKVAGDREPPLRGFPRVYSDPCRVTLPQGLRAMNGLSAALARLARPPARKQK